MPRSVHADQDHRVVVTAHGSLFSLVEGCGLWSVGARSTAVVDADQTARRAVQSGLAPWWSSMHAIRRSLFVQLTDPRIDQGNCAARKIGGVARHHCHAVYQGGGGNHRVGLTARIRHMQTRTLESHRRINRQDTSRKCRENMVLEPCSEQNRLSAVAALESKYSSFQLQHGDCRQVEAGRGDLPCPSDYIRIGLEVFSKFRDDIGVEQVHQSRSTSRGLIGLRTGWNSMSSMPGIASMSTMLTEPPASFW